jgi:hypothetical protein
MIDLDAIDKRHDESVLVGRKSMTEADLVKLLASCSDIPELLAEISRMQAIVTAARGFVAKRNELHGDPSNPAWWQGQDWALARTIFEYEESQR